MTRSFISAKKISDYAFSEKVCFIDAYHLLHGQKSQEDLKAAQDFFTLRKNIQKSIFYPPGLPISQMKDRIKELWQGHQIILIRSETGSGKSTQLPKIAMELGFSDHGLIGMTQPRRLATRAIAQRLAEELCTRPGDCIGWQVRHQDHSLPKHHVKVMTDGILLQEIQYDKFLRKYECIIIDEAHERSVNIDLILGYLKWLLVQRPDLKVAILSATIQSKVFKEFFPDIGLLDIEGRSYPIDDYYLPDEQLGKLDKALWALNQALELDGDILMFCATEAEISWYAERLEKRYPHLEVLKLYARMPVAMQQRIFQTSDKKRLILATNIAETSLTIPNVRHVIDTGEQKIADYNPALKIMRYPIVPIAQSNINQRRGRAGRTAPGQCFYLYTKEERQQRPEEIPPQILRSGLSQVLLKILALNIGSIEEFPFIATPLPASIKEALGVLTLFKLITPDQKLTKLGKKVSGYPIDPRFVLILLKAQDLKCAYLVAIIVAFLNGDDPRLRPFEQRALADKAHAKYQDSRSDFMTILSFWSYLQENQKNLSNKKWQEFCHQNFINAMHVRSWHENLEQLLELFQIKPIDIDVQELEHSVILIHRALLAGLYDRIFKIQKDGTYLGPRTIQAKIHPGGACSKSKPVWIMALNTERTTDLFLRFVGPIELHVLTDYAKHLIKTTSGDPFYCPEAQEVYVHLKGNLFGLPVIDSRRVLLRLADEKMAHREFVKGWILHSLDEDRLKDLKTWSSSYETALKYAERVRELNAVKSPSEIADFAVDLWPAEIYSGATFNQYKSLIPSVRYEFFLKYPLSVSIQDYPDQLIIDGKNIELNYLCDAQDEHDGVTMIIPQALWLRYHPEAWLMIHPGYRHSIWMELIQQLPKNKKQQLQPLDDLINFLTSDYQWPSSPRAWLCQQLKDYYQVYCVIEDFSIESLTRYIKPYIIVEKNDDWIDYGRLSSNLIESSSIHAKQMTVAEDWVRDVFCAYQSGLLKAPCEHSKILIRYLDFFEWKAALLKAYLLSIENHLQIKKNNQGYLQSIKQKKGAAAQLIKNLALKNIFIQSSLPIASLESLMQPIENNTKLISFYAEEIFKQEKNLEFLIHAKKNDYKIDLFKKASQALHSEKFLIQLPSKLLERLPLWNQLMNELVLKEKEKYSLCLRFVDDWNQFIKSASLLTSVSETESSALWGLFFELGISLLMQPIRPIVPLSFKRALQLAEQTEGFKLEWI